MDEVFLQTLVGCLHSQGAAQVLRLVAARQAARGDGIVHVWRLIALCAQAGGVSELKALDDATPENNVLKLFTHFGMAYVAAWDGDVDETSRRLRAALRIAFAIEEILATDPQLDQLFRVLVQHVQSIDAGEIPSAGCTAVPAIDSTREPHRLTVLTSCNAKYFERFAPNFIASVREHLPEAGVHIHVMNPTPESGRQMADFARALGMASFSTEECREEAERFACGRFVVAHDVMLQRRSDVLISDIDVDFTPRTAQLPTLLAGQDGGMFERKNVSPMEICHCSLTYFRFTPGALRLLALLQNYLRLKLNDIDHPEWMLDQCALFVVTRRALRREPQAAWDGLPTFTWCNLAARGEGDLAAFQVNQAIGGAEKHALRYHAEKDLRFYFVPLADGGVAVRAASNSG